MPENTRLQDLVWAGSTDMEAASAVKPAPFPELILSPPWLFTTTSCQLDISYPCRLVQWVGLLWLLLAPSKLALCG